MNTPAKVPYGIKESRFKTFSSKNLYAYVYERSLELAHQQASLGLIVQLTALSSVGEWLSYKIYCFAEAYSVAPSIPS